MPALRIDRSANSDKLQLREAKLSDCDFLHSLRNSPEVRQASVSTSEIPRDVHKRWLVELLGNPQRALSIIEVNGQPGGSLRLDADTGGIQVSIALTAGSRGRGLGRRAIALALEKCQLSGRRFVATVHKSNLPSLKAFISAGFARVESVAMEGEDFIQLERKRESNDQ